MGERLRGFGPVCDEKSRVLILGSFPSVMSRQMSFYYGNPRNRFWGTLCSFFGEEVPAETDGKIRFLLRRRIALWDIVSSCETKGSMDRDLRACETADLTPLFAKAPLAAVFLNGRTAEKIYLVRYGDVSVPHFALPSTSPANARFSQEPWREALRKFFPDAGRLGEEETAPL